jgi:RimJ/RimL family protein N-acetyltransferase
MLEFDQNIFYIFSIHRGFPVPRAASMFTLPKSSSMITLRPYTESDFYRTLAWIDSYKKLIQWAGPVQFTYPLTIEQLRHYSADVAAVQSVRRIFAAVDEEGTVCGQIELGALDFVNETATVCRVLMSPDSRGKGHGLEMMRAILTFGFEAMHLRRIDLRVYSFNYPAIKCYENAGFVKEGILRKSIKMDEEYWDTILMAMLREEWNNLTPTLYD